MSGAGEYLPGTPAPRSGKSPDSVLTIGHSTREIDEFIGLLRTNGVELLVDVRRFPGSRRNPQYGSEALEKALAGEGIAYLHMEGLGGRRGQPARDSPHAGWRVAAFRAYADQMDTREWQDSLAELEARARARKVAYMCAEAVPWRCHRRLISDALVARGWEVWHILGGNRLDRHALPEFARVLPDTRIVYGPTPGDS